MIPLASSTIGCLSLVMKRDAVRLQVTGHRVVYCCFLNKIIVDGISVVTKGGCRFHCS